MKPPPANRFNGRARPASRLRRRLALIVAGIACAGCAQAPVEPLDPDLRARADARVIERGRHLVRGPAHCVSCHAGATTSDDPDALSGGKRFDIRGVGSFVSANLTSDVETGLGSWTDEELFRVLRTGRNRDGRPLAPMMDTSGMSDADLVAVVSYLRTLPPVRNAAEPTRLGLLGQVALSWIVGTPVHEPRTPPSEPPQGAELGRYLADRVANCRGCHTPRSAVTARLLLDRPFAGGLKLHEPNGTFEVPDITRNGALRAHDEQSFLALFRARARRPTDSPMPWAEYGAMSDAELAAIFRYLDSLPAISQ